MLKHFWWLLTLYALLASCARPPEPPPVVEKPALEEPEPVEKARGTRLLVCAVWGCPLATLSMHSAFPWSAVTRASPPTSLKADSTRPRQASTASTALMAASSLPVCPTMSVWA